MQEESMTHAVKSVTSSAGKANDHPLLKPVVLSPNARIVIEKRYLRRGADGKPAETVEEMFWRIASYIAKAELEYDGDEKTAAKAFYEMLSGLRFFPNSPTFSGAGTPLGQLAACFVLPISDDMGRDSSGIFQTLRDAALIQQTGGGNGFSFSRIRPKGSLVNSSSGQATGPVGFLRVYDKAFGEIAQGGTRRGANMAVLRIDHPDIEEFISCKTSENAITNFNISVGILDSFMEAVHNDSQWDLRFPDVFAPEYRGFQGTFEQAERAGIPIRTYRTVRARDLFQTIVQQSHHNGEPGVLFLDTANRFNPLSHLYALEATNPCGEQWLGPYENCCLGSLNLSRHFGTGKRVDWEKLRKDVILATRFLDDVVAVNGYVPAVPKLKEAAFQARRIGLGLMGLADLMYHVGIRYGSPEGQEFAAQVMEFIRFHAMQTSISLAKERGAFPKISGSIYDPAHMTWEPPQPFAPFSHDYQRPPLPWAEITQGIRTHGIRNAAQCTIAPTGTIATVAGCEGYGCEPVFALAYIRHVNDNGKDLPLPYVSPLFEQALQQAKVGGDASQTIIDQVIQEGTCQRIAELPETIRETFVVSQDITAEEHVRMQASLQRFVDNSLSKTINFPSIASDEDVSKAYRLAWELGCKGITVYVTGSRQQVVLETAETAKSKGKDISILSVDKETAARPAMMIPTTTPSSDQPIPLWYETKRPRPRRLPGLTFQVDTPLGKAFVTVNENDGQQPFEVFITTAKAGSETAAVSEALGRLISYTLRLGSPIPPRDRLLEIIRQLAGIGGGRPLGFGPNRILSLPDGVAHVLADYLESTDSSDDQEEVIIGTSSSPSLTSPSQIMMKIGDLCPQCGEPAVINEEGCRKCYACGHSEC
jgi:ribonucleoside-diphosphate reductase alpha chain